jgi:AcrR family transcriptional regulator
VARQTDDTKRDRIIEAAFTAFGEKGFGNTSIKDIAEKADVALGSVYTYFKDKDDLFRSTVEAGWAEFYEGMDEIFSSSESIQTKILKLIDFGFNLFKKVHPLLRGMFSEAARKDLFAEKVDHLCDQIYEMFAAAIQLGVIEASLEENMGKFLIKTIVTGIMFQLSLINPLALDREVEAMKNKVKLGLSDFFELGRL